MDLREVHKTINRSISYSNSPLSLDRILSEQAVKLAGWDFDGTIADTERLHRATFHAAVQELADAPISTKEWEKDHFRKAFGLPELETCYALSSALSTHYSKFFQTAIINALKFQAPKEDSITTVAHAIKEKRGEIFDFYTNNLTRNEDKDGQVTLSVSDDVVGQNDIDTRRLELLRPVQVSLYPAVPKVIKLLSEHGVRQGICTSSPQRFVDPLLKELGILEQFDNDANVYVDTVDPTLTKPNPYPFQLLAERLRGPGGATSSPQPADDMIRFENSAGGAMSATRAGKGTTIVRAENTASVAGKLQQKLVDLIKGGEESPVEGEALFVPCLSTLISDRTPEKRAVVKPSSLPPTAK